MQLVTPIQTLQDLDHWMRTVHEESQISYGGPLWTVPLQGTGQGNGAGPTLWAIVSSPVLDVLWAKGYDTLFKTAISNDIVQYVGFSFVDDRNQIQPGRTSGDSAVSIAQQMQQAVDK